MVPKCLRVEAKCPARLMNLAFLQELRPVQYSGSEYEAEKLGYAALVAEGSAIVQPHSNGQDRRDLAWPASSFGTCLSLHGSGGSAGRGDSFAAG